MRRQLAIIASATVLVGTGLGLAPAEAKPGRPADTGPAATDPSASRLSVTERLSDRRVVAAGTRAQALGFADGGFYAHGWHITGEMGGVWTPPVKLVDGVWFGLDDQWVGPATRFTSGRGYTRYALPTTAGLQVERTDFAPDGRRGALFGLKVTNPGAARTAKLTIDTHSELMGQFPWGFSGVSPNAKDNLPDRGAYDGRRLTFTDRGTLPGGAAHNYAAAVGTSLTPTSGAIGDDYWGPRAGHRCTGTEPGAPADPKPSVCDDGPFGNGTGGRLTYAVKLKAGATKTIWLGVAGSDQGPAKARKELRLALKSPARQLRAKKADRRALAAHTRLNLPGDRQTQRAIDWGKQNIADLTQQSRNLKVRWTDQGKQFPKPAGTLARMDWVGAGYPDYPWLFGTDAEYTSFAAVSVGQFEAIKGHLRALRDVSDLINDRSGVVTHEVTADGSVYFGQDSRTENPDGTTSYDFNTDETVKFPSTVALMWRWTGDDAFMRSMYDFSKRNLRYVVDQLDADGDGWPEGLGNVERGGMGPEKLDNSVYFIRGLYDLGAMAQAQGDTATRRWSLGLARDLRQRFDTTWWYADAAQYADSLEADGDQVFQKHWISQTPMEVELTVGGRAVPGLAPRAHGRDALAARQSDCFSGTAPDNQGLFHTGCGGGPEGKGEKIVFGLTTSIQSIGEGNYGRLAADQQGRYIKALTDPMFSQPATDGTPDEQPGAMPEIFASPDQGANIDRCWTCRSMFMQAWGNYGTAWAVVHQWLGVRPDVGRDRLSVVPQVPAGQTVIRGQAIRLGDGAIAVTARHRGDRYRTSIRVPAAVGARAVEIGHTVPRGATLTRVLLDGKPAARYQVRTTNRGLEVTVPTGRGRHTLEVRTS